MTGSVLRYIERRVINRWRGRGVGFSLLPFGSKDAIKIGVKTLKRSRLQKLVNLG